MSKRDGFQTYLVAVRQRREATRVYALVAQSQAEALEIVISQASADVDIEVVGLLSRLLAEPYTSSRAI